MLGESVDNYPQSSSIAVTPEDSTSVQIKKKELSNNFPSFLVVRHIHPPARAIVNQMLDQA
jgi:hypothetical protein